MRSPGADVAQPRRSPGADVAGFTPCGLELGCQARHIARDPGEARHRVGGITGRRIVVMKGDMHRQPPALQRCARWRAVIVAASNPSLCRDQCKARQPSPRGNVWKQRIVARVVAVQSDAALDERVYVGRVSLIRRRRLVRS